VAYAESERLERRSISRNTQQAQPRLGKGCGAIVEGWSLEPDVGRVAHGIPRRVDRLKGLGNAVVPQIPEIIGNAIMQNVEIL